MNFWLIVISRVTSYKSNFYLFHKIWSVYNTLLLSLLIYSIFPIFSKKLSVICVPDSFSLSLSLQEFIHFLDPQPRVQPIHQKANTHSLHKNTKFLVIYWQFFSDTFHVWISERWLAIVLKAGWRINVIVACQKGRETCVSDVNEIYEKYM